MSYDDKPFALFVIAENIDLDDIKDKILYKVGKNSTPLYYVLWLATDNYDDAPKKTYDRATNMQITSFAFPWTGKTVEDCAKWLQNVGDREFRVDRQCFAVVDEYSKKEGTLLVCRNINWEDPFKDVELQYYPKAMWSAASCLLYPDHFEKDIMAYRRARKMEEKPDRSKGMVSTEETPSTEETSSTKKPSTEETPSAEGKHSTEE